MSRGRRWHRSSVTRLIYRVDAPAHQRATRPLRATRVWTFLAMSRRSAPVRHGRGGLLNRLEGRESGAADFAEKPGVGRGSAWRVVVIVSGITVPESRHQRLHRRRTVWKYAFHLAGGEVVSCPSITGSNSRRAAGSAESFLAATCNHHDSCFEGKTGARRAFADGSMPWDGPPGLPTVLGKILIRNERANGIEVIRAVGDSWSPASRPATLMSTRSSVAPRPVRLVAKDGRDWCS